MHLQCCQHCLSCVCVCRCCAWRFACFRCEEHVCCGGQSQHSPSHAARVRGGWVGWVNHHAALAWALGRYIFRPSMPYRCNVASQIIGPNCDWLRHFTAVPGTAVATYLTAVNRCGARVRASLSFVSTAWTAERDEGSLPTQPFTKPLLGLGSPFEMPSICGSKRGEGCF